MNPLSTKAALATLVWGFVASPSASATEPKGDYTTVALTRNLDPNSPYLRFAHQFDSHGSFVNGPMIDNSGRIAIVASYEDEENNTRTGLIRDLTSSQPDPIIINGMDAPGAFYTRLAEPIQAELSQGPIIHSMDGSGYVLGTSGYKGASQYLLYSWSPASRKLSPEVWPSHPHFDPGSPVEVVRRDGDRVGPPIPGVFVDRPRTLFTAVLGFRVMEATFQGTDGLRLAGAFIANHSTTDLRPARNKWSFLGEGKVVETGVFGVVVQRGSHARNLDIDLISFDGLSRNDLFHVGQDLPGADGQLHRLVKINQYDVSYLGGAVVLAELENGEVGYWQSSPVNLPPRRLVSGVPPLSLPIKGGEGGSLGFLSWPLLLGEELPYYLMMATETAIWRLSLFTPSEGFERLVNRGDTLPGVDWTVNQINPFYINRPDWGRLLFFQATSSGFPANRGLFALREDGKILKIMSTDDEVAPGISPERFLLLPDPIHPKSGNACWGGRPVNNRGEIAFVVQAKRQSDDEVGYAVMRGYAPSGLKLAGTEDRIKIFREGENMVLTWPGNRTIEESQGQGWSVVEGAKSPFKVPITSTRRFWRYKPE